MNTRSMFPGVEGAEVLRICGILDSNAFKIDGLNGIRALFVQAAMVNHDCMPNCRVYFDREQNLHLVRLVQHSGTGTGTETGTGTGTGNGTGTGTCCLITR